MLLTHPAVTAAAVVGAPDETWVEAVTAFVTLRPGATVPAAESPADLVRSRLAAYKVPKQVHVVDAIPLCRWARRCAARCATPVEPPRLTGGRHDAAGRSSHGAVAVLRRRGKCSRAGQGGQSATGESRTRTRQDCEAARPRRHTAASAAGTPLRVTPPRCSAGSLRVQA